MVVSLGQPVKIRLEARLLYKRERLEARLSSLFYNSFLKARRVHVPKQVYKTLSLPRGKGWEGGNVIKSLPNVVTTRASCCASKKIALPV